MKLPFSLCRESRSGLVEQSVAGMKSAIASDFYKIGEKVPSLNDFARRYGVSLKVPRMAYARLVAEGWLKARRGVGFTAASPDVRVWKGRVLYVQFCIGYYQSALCACVQRRLSEAGYRSVSILLEDTSRQSLETLEVALEDRYEIVFADCPRPEYEKLLEKSGMPYVVTHGGISARRKPGPGCKGVIVEDRSFLKDMIATIRKSGIRSMAFVDASPVHDGYAEIIRSSKANVDVSIWRTPVISDGGRTDAFRCGAERFFSEGLSRGMRLPELLVFNDDYIAEGALYAMVRTGVDIPRDVKIITLYNKGLGLTSPLDFTRMEVDPDLDARITVEFLVACMENRRVARVPRRIIRFVTGSTL